MRTIAKLLSVIVLVLVAAVVVVGPGRVVAGAEYPFGGGPWGSTGRYCQDIYGLGHVVDAWHRSSQPLTPSETKSVLPLEKMLTKSGPRVPRADFTAFFETTGNVNERMDGESVLINTWWNQNCAGGSMEAPASLSRTWSGVLSHGTFTHYRKNVIKIRNFSKVTSGRSGSIDTKPKSTQ